MKFLEDLKEKMNSRKSKINVQMQQVKQLGKNIETIRLEIAAKEDEYMDTLDVELLKAIEDLKKEAHFIEKNKEDRERLLEAAEKKTYDIDWQTIEKDIDQVVKSSRAAELMDKIQKAQEDYYKLLEEFEGALGSICSSYKDLVHNQQYMDISLQRKIVNKYSKVVYDNNAFMIKGIDVLEETKLRDRIKSNSKYNKEEFRALYKADMEFTEITGLSGLECYDKIPSEHRAFCERRLEIFESQLSSSNLIKGEEIKLEKKIEKLKMLLRK